MITPQRSYFLAHLLACAFLCAVVPNLHAAEWSVYEGPYESAGEAKDQSRYLDNIFSFPLEVWKVRGAFYILLGHFTDPETAREVLRQVQDSGYESAFLQQRSTEHGRLVMTANKRIGGAAEFSHTQKEVESPLVKADDAPATERREGDERSLKMDRAWSELSYGNFSEACELFSQASQSSSGQLEANNGWAQCLIQQGRHAQAIEKMVWLAQREYQPLKNLPRLIASLKKTGDLTQQYHYEQKLTRAQQKAGIDHNEKVALHQQALVLIHENRATELLSFLDQNESRFRQCQSVEILMDSAQFFRHLTVPSRQVNRRHSVRLYKQVLAYCPGKWQLRVSVFESLAMILGAKAFREIVENEITDDSQPKGYRAKIKHICTVNLMQLVYALPLASTEKDPLIEEVLTIQPNHKDARSAQAWAYYHRKDFENSLQWFRSLHKQSPRKKEYAQGVYYNLVATGQSKQAMEFALKNRLQKQLKESLERQLKDADESQKPLIAQQILVLDKNHAWALTVAAWFHFEKQEFSQAYDLFASLTKNLKRKNKAQKGALNSAWEGRLLALLGTKNWAGAGRDVNRSPFTEKDKQAWRLRIERRRAQNAFDQGNYSEAKGILLSLTARTTEDVQLLAWCEHYLGNSETALHMFADEHAVHPSASTAEGVLKMLASTARQEPYRQLLERLMASDETQYQKLAGAAAIQQHPQMAAQFLPPTGAGQEVTQNWHGPSAELHYRYSEQTGSVGKDKLVRRIKSAWLHSPWYQRWNGALVVHDEHLTPGQIREIDFGRDYLSSIANDDWTQSHWNVQTPQVRLNYAGHGHVAQAIVGTTPQNGPVNPVPAWRLAVKWDSLRVDGFRLPRTDSLLGYIGMPDPYDETGSAWGRVLETGVSANKDFSLGGASWLGLSAKATEQQGKDTQVNQERALDVAYGLTDERWNMMVTRGVFMGLQQHSHDGDNYTHGYGGVYSPNDNLNLGLLLNLESLTRSPFWWRWDMSAVYYQSKTKDGPLYPLTDRSESFSGATGDGIAYRVAGRWHYFMGHQAKWYGVGEWTIAGGYQFWQVMLGLQWYFDGRVSVGLPDAPMRIWDVRWAERP